VLFMQLADGLDDATWLYHLTRGDTHDGSARRSRTRSWPPRQRISKRSRTRTPPRAAHTSAQRSSSAIRWRPKKIKLLQSHGAQW
jgi:hypothetical protein